MRILHVTDTHLGLAGARGALAALAVRALDRALAPVHSGAVDLVLHTGDLFDRSEPPAAAIRAARDLLGAAARRVPVVVVAGNHDRHGVGRSLAPIPAGIHVVDVPRIVTLPGFRIGGIPHVPDAAVWGEHAAELARRGCDLLACHQSFHGQRVPGFTFRAGRPAETVGEIPPGIRWIASGHLHPRQRVRVGEAEIVCPGSAVRTSFREGDAPKAFAVWSFHGAPTVRFVDLPSPPWVRVRAPADLAGVSAGVVVRTADPALATAAHNRGAIVLGEAPAEDRGLF